MVPTEYRLEVVVVGLVERLDGARRSYETREEASAGFQRAADEHLDAVLGEWADLRFSPYAERHASFLRREVKETFLPRFTKAACEMTEAERAGFGMGVWATPAGRVGLVVISLLLLWLVLLRFERLPVMWPLTAMDLGLPFLPDLLRVLQHRRYEGILKEVVGDMERIQEQTLAYTPVAEGPETSPRKRAVRRVPPSEQAER